MNEKDARAGRTIMSGELDTINEYEGMKPHVSPQTKDVIDDIIEEEKEHVGEAAKVIDANDPTAKKQMLNGVNEASQHIEESAKQMHFSTYNGTMTEKEPEVKSVEEYDNRRWSNMSDEQKKKTNPERYERERTQSKKASISFRDVFAQKRGEVIAKANGIVKSDEGRYGINDEGEEYSKEETYALPGSEQDAPEFPDDDDVDTSKARHNTDRSHKRGQSTRANPASKKEADKKKAEEGDIGLSKDPRLYSTGADIQNKRGEEEYKEGMHKLTPRGDVKGMDKRKNRIDYSTREKNDAGRTQEEEKASNLNAKGLLKEKELALKEQKQNPSVSSQTPEYQRVVGEGMDLDAKYEENGSKIAQIEMMLDDPSLSPEKAQELSVQLQILSKENEGIIQQKMQNIKARDTVISRNGMNINPDTTARLQAALDGMTPQERVALLRQLKGMKERGMFENGTWRRKRASASNPQTSPEHIEKKKSFGAESKARLNKENTDKASPRLKYATGVHRDPFKGYFNTMDPAFKQRFDPRNSRMQTSGDLYVTDNPLGETSADYPLPFSMEAWRRYNSTGGRTYPQATLVPADFRSLGGSMPNKRYTNRGIGGGSHQVVRQRVQAKDMHGTPIYDEVRTPILELDENGSPIPINIDGETVWKPKLDAKGNIMYRTERKPRMIDVGDLYMTQRGKDLSYLQSIIGRLDNKWDPKTKQYVPLGMESRLDKYGNIPDAFFNWFLDPEGKPDQSKLNADTIMERFREFGYTGNDNRWNPDISADQDKFYQDEAYRQLVDEGVIGPDMKEPGEKDRLIQERADMIRAEDEKDNEQSQLEHAQIREDNYDFDQDLQDRAYAAASELYDQWLESFDDYDFGDGGVILYDDRFPEGQRVVPYDTIDAWIESNRMALIEQYRKDHVRDATAEEKDALNRARRSGSLNRAVSEYYLNRWKEEHPDASLEDIADIGERIQLAIEQMPFEQKESTMEGIRNKDEAAIRNGEASNPLYMHPDDIYHHSRAHEEDLERLKEKLNEAYKGAAGDILYINGWRDLDKATDQAFSDTNTKFGNIVQDLKEGKIRLEPGKGGRYNFVHSDLVSMPKEGRTEKDIQRQSRAISVMDALRRALEYMGSSPEHYIDSSYRNYAGYPSYLVNSPETALAYDLKRVIQEAREEELYDTASRMGYSPSQLRVLMEEAGAATRRQNRAGNDLSKISDKDIRAGIQYLLSKQGASEFGGDIDNDIRAEYSHLMDNTDDNIYRTDAVNKVLGDIRNGVMSGRYMEQLGADSRDYKQLEKFINNMDYDAQSKYLNNVYTGKLRRGLYLSPDVELGLQRLLRQYTDKNRKKFVEDSLFDKFRDRIRSHQSFSSALDAQNANVDNVPPEVPKMPDKTAEAERIIASLAKPRTAEERALRTQMDLQAKLLRKYGYKDEDIHNKLVESLIRGKLKRFDKEPVFGKPKTGTVSSDLPVETKPKLSESEVAAREEGFVDGRRNSAGGTKGLSERDDDKISFEGMTLEDVEQKYNEALDYIAQASSNGTPKLITDPRMLTEDQKNNNQVRFVTGANGDDPRLKQAWDFISAVDAERSKTPDPDKGANAAQIFWSRRGTDAMIDQANKDKAAGVTHIGTPPNKDTILSQKKKGNSIDRFDTTGKPNSHGNDKDKPLTWDKPLRSKPSAASEDKDEHKEASASFRDIFAERRSKVLKKYHGI